MDSTVPDTSMSGSGEFGGILGTKVEYRRAFLGFLVEISARCLRNYCAFQNYVEDANVAVNRESS